MKKGDFVEYTFEVGYWADHKPYKREYVTTCLGYWGKKASKNNVVDGSLTTAVAGLAVDFPVPSGYYLRDVRLVGMEKRSKNKRTVVVKKLRGKK
jgi:hypothetical protein